MAQRSRPHASCLEERRHEHVFGQEARKAGETRTLVVIALTAVTMVGEVAAGLAFGSMALLADGLHMGSHAAALAVTAAAYAYARRHATDPRFSFGTGKVNALGGYTGAVLLGLFAAFMAFESTRRFFEPVAIRFDEAILVAAVGLAVNAVSAVILGARHTHDHDHDHPHAQPARGDDATSHTHATPRAHQDHNLRAAYLHVLADAVTSIAAIAALLAGKFLGLAWMDPVMGILGSLLVARWAVGLSRQSAGVLLDRQAPEPLQRRVREAVESGSTDRVLDLHLWSIGPGLWAAELVILAEAPQPPEHYKCRLPADVGVVHATVEVVPCPHDEEGAPRRDARAPDAYPPPH